MILRVLKFEFKLLCFNIKWIHNKSKQKLNNRSQSHKTLKHSPKTMYKKSSSRSIAIKYFRLNKVFEDYFLSDLQKIAMTKFIKTHFSNKDNKEVDRIRPWLINKINNQRIHPKEEMQKGCPDIIPGLRAQPWW